MEKKQLPPLPDADDSIVHIYPWDLERMGSNETAATVFSVAVGCPDGESVPLYTAEQMREYALSALAANPVADMLRPAGLSGSRLSGDGNLTLMFATFEQAAAFNDSVMSGAHNHRYVK